MFGYSVVEGVVAVDEVWFELVAVVELVYCLDFVFGPLCDGFLAEADDLLFHLLEVVFLGSFGLEEVCETSVDGDGFYCLCDVDSRARADVSISSGVS